MGYDVQTCSESKSLYSDMKAELKAREFEQPFQGRMQRAVSFSISGLSVCVCLRTVDTMLCSAAATVELL